MSPASSHRRPPPDYFSRSVQMRLLMLVSMFMLVVLLMVEAGKPKNWQWMFGRQKVEEIEGIVLDSASRPPGMEELPSEQGGRESERGGSQPGVPKSGVFPDGEASRGVPPAGQDGSGGPAAGGDHAAPPHGLQPGEAAGPLRPPVADMTMPDDDPLIRTQLDGWRRGLNQLGREPLRSLQVGLKAVRDGRLLTEEETAAWNESISRLDQSWRTYHEDALTSLAEDASGLNSSQRDEWLAVLQRSRVQWQDDFQPALEAFGRAGQLDESQRAALGRMQALLDQVAISQVEDNTVLRLAEKDAWFRMFESLATTDPGELAAASTGAVGYLQLYKQPEVYRGKLVTVRGEARMAYRVQAPRNLYGITHYYIFWVKPTGGADSPLVVYSLETPPGFPPIKDKDLDRTTTELQEDVEFTGYFFKRWAYRARDGASTAPLLLARCARWHRSTDLAGRTGRLPSTGFLVLTVGISLALACGLTAVVYFRGRGSAAGSWFKRADDATSKRLRNLARQEHPTPIEASLRTLAEFDSRTRRPDER